MRRCAICGSPALVQDNHVGGRNHLATFTMPFCEEHHKVFHTMLHQSGVDLRYTDDGVERCIRALQAIKVAEWMLLERLKYEHQQQQRGADGGCSQVSRNLFQEQIHQ